MSITHPDGLSSIINRKIVLFTTLLSISALLSLVFLNIYLPADGGYKSIVYGVCLFACSFFSYLYTIRFSLFRVSWLRQLDHAAIFLLIAGTYTPFAVNDIRGLFGIPLLYLIWGLATAGICLRLAFRGRHDRLFIGLYLALGWLFLTGIPDVMHYVPRFSIIFLALGAAVYSVGAAIFAFDIGRWTDPVWHGCVLGASALHFVAVLGEVTGEQ